MPLELTAGLVAALVVGVWWLVRRRTRRSDQPFPDIPAAPPGAESMGGWRLNPHGLGTYNLELGEVDGPVEQERRSA
jgi:hypothetical protein